MKNIEQAMELIKKQLNELTPLVEEITVEQPMTELVETEFGWKRYEIGGEVIIRIKLFN